MRPGDARPRNASDAPAGAARALQRAAREGPPELRPSAPHGHTRYDGSGRVADHTSPENQGTGAKTVFSDFDSVCGLPKSIQRPDHSQPELILYDSDTSGSKMGLTKQHVKPEGGITKFDYDDLHRLVIQTAPAGGSGDAASSIATSTYDPDSNLVEVDGPDTQNVKHEIDRLGRLRKSTRKATGALNLISEFKYDRDGNTREVKDPGNKFSITTYDSLGRVAQERRPGPPTIVTDYGYNLNGAVRTRTMGSQTSTSTYSGRGLLLKGQNSGFTGESDETVYFEDGTVKESARKSGAVVVGLSINGYV